MGLLTFALNVTLDGCCDHRAVIADDAMLRYCTRLMDRAGGMLFGRTTYELLESAWPAVARDPDARPADRAWARKLEAALEQLGLIDEYRLMVHPILAGHGPTLFAGLRASRRLTLLDTKRFKSGAMALHYRKA